MLEDEVFKTGALGVEGLFEPGFKAPNHSNKPSTPSTPSFCSVTKVMRGRNLALSECGVG